MYALVQICHVVVSPNFKIGTSPKFLDVVVSSIMGASLTIMITLVYKNLLRKYTVIFIYHRSLIVVC